MRIILYWEHGIEFDYLLSKLRERYDHPNFVITDGPVLHRFGLSYATPEGKLRCSVLLSQSDSGFLMKMENVHRLHWSITPAAGDPVNRPWLNFSLGRGEMPGDPYDCVKDGRLCQLFVGVEHDFAPWQHADHPEALISAINDYQEMKLLFEFVDCDHVEAFSEAYDCGIYPGDPDPDFEGRILRFAKKGRQVFIRPLDEGRAMREDEEVSWRVVIDQPTPSSTS